MPKAKLKLESSEVNQFSEIAELLEIKTGVSKTIGTITYLELSYRKADQLFEAGRMMETSKNLTLSVDETSETTEKKGKK